MYSREQRLEDLLKQSLEHLECYLEDLSAYGFKLEHKEVQELMGAIEAILVESS